MNNNIPVITIDGPSSVGKSVLSKIISNKLNWWILESGLMYRLLALLIFKKNIPIVENNIIYLLKNFNFVLLKAKNSNSKIIHCSIIGEIASKLATFSKIRKILLDKQRYFRKLPGLIAEGRDMGTTVFPDATIKFFLDANLETRVYRRIKQFKKLGLSFDYQKILKQLRCRDARDQNRLISPLYPAKDAIILNSTNMTVSEVVEYCIKQIKKKIII